MKKLMRTMPKQTIKEIKAQLATITNPNDELLVQLAADERQGVQMVVNQWQRQYAKLTAAKLAFQEHLKIEQARVSNDCRS